MANTESLDGASEQDNITPINPIQASMLLIRQNILKKKTASLEPPLSVEDDFELVPSRPTSPEPSESRKRRCPESPSLRQYTSRAQELARTKRMRPESQADLVRYTTLPRAEREFMAAGIMLDIRDKTTDAAEAADWQLPLQLKTNCLRYTSACIVSPIIPSYKLNFQQVVMKLLRGLDADTPGSSQLPAPINAGRTELVEKEISECAIKKRSDLKGKIEKSIASKDCIELLCENITGPLNIAVTTLLYARVAFLRDQFISYPDMQDPRKFWGHIDAQLKVLHQEFPTAAEMKDAMDYFLTKDHAAFKNGNTKQHYFVDPCSTPAWQQAADKELQSIIPEGGPQPPRVPAAQAAQTLQQRAPPSGRRAAPGNAPGGGSGSSSTTGSSTSGSPAGSSAE
ncbi:hypothetical protein AURDEDRAFT_163615 [Auricularia subglabra TFB-10046 SS5]|nr:hypothetical protein AURDEDRAFT_163615 [Auricularia subglabra TFB-10046 SS5]